MIYPYNAKKIKFKFIIQWKKRLLWTILWILFIKLSNSLFLSIFGIHVCILYHGTCSRKFCTWLLFVCCTVWFQVLGRLLNKMTSKSISSTALILPNRKKWIQSPEKQKSERFLAWRRTTPVFGTGKRRFQNLPVKWSSQISSRTEIQTYLGIIW
jgi:hypothetical protein